MNARAPKIELTPATILQAGGRCVMREQKEGKLFYNVRTDELHLMPAAGFVVYQLCDGLRSVAEIEQWLADAFPAERDALPAALTHFLTRLVERGILETSHDC